MYELIAITAFVAGGIIVFVGILTIAVNIIKSKRQ